MNQPLLVTLVDPDAKGLALLTYAFQKEGFIVAGTSDLAMAPELARTTTARLVAVVLRAPESASVALLSALRQGRDTATLPLVALGPASSRPAALEAGALAYFDTPLYIRDAIVVSRLFLQARQPFAERAPRAGHAELPEMQGSLDEIHGLYFLIRAMLGTGRSGTLQVARGARKGEVKFFEGAVTSAQVRTLQAFPALHQLLLWKGATLTLKLREVPRRAQFPASGVEILEECERFLRDVTHAAQELGSFQTVFAQDSRQPRSDRPVAIPQEVAPVARLFDGVRTLGDVIEDSPFRIFDTLRVVKRLLDAGTLMARVAGAPTAVMNREASQPAPARQRTRTASNGLPRAPRPRDLDALLEDRRVVAGERRKGSARRTPMPFEKPAAKPAPAPILLTTRKSTSGAFAAGEIRPAKGGAGATTPRASATRAPVGASAAPSVEVRRDAVPASLSLDRSVPSPATSSVSPASVASPASRPAPIAAAPLSARQPSGPIRATGAAKIGAKSEAKSEAKSDGRSSKSDGKSSGRSPAGKTPAPGAPAFNALEADFFAREADLYKQESGESFDDLERGGDANGAARGPRSISSRADPGVKKT